MSPDRFTRRALLASCALLCATASVNAQQPLARTNGAAQSGVYLVFPFENAGATPRLDWLGEGLEELTIQALSAVGQQVYSHAGRTTELERNGLPFSAKLSRASMLRVAQDLDADFVVFGSLTSDGKALTIDSRVLRTDPLTLLPSVRETGPLDSLMTCSPGSSGASFPQAIKRTAPRWRSFPRRSARCVSTLSSTISAVSWPMKTSRASGNL